MPSKRVLIVDDDAGVRELLAAIVQREGFQADTAADGEDAMRMIAGGAYDAIITDLMLPRFGGFEVLRRLQEGETARIPVLVITGRYTDPSTAEMIRQESNVAGFLEKPISPGTLATSLRKLFDGKSTGA